MVAKIPNDFFKLWAPDMAYVLGYWWADGHMLQSRAGKRVGFTSKDGEHLEQIAQAIGIGRVARIIAGTEAFITDMALAIEEATGIPTPKCHLDQNIWKMNWSGMYAKCLAAWLDEDCNLCLERKRIFAVEFLRWQPKLYHRSRITPKMRQLFGHLLPE